MRTPAFDAVVHLPLRTLCLAAALALPLAPARGSTAERLDLPQLVAQSDLVFEGTVIAIDHKNSEVVEPGDRRLPHTFVTFAIKDVVKGASSAGNAVTVRFLGGPDGTGRALVIPGVPQFAVGDRDLLFVRNEKSAICPVVGFEHGRLRVVRGEIFDSLGHALWMTPDGNLLPDEEKIDLSTPGYPPVVKQPDAATESERAGLETNGPPAGSMRPDAEGFKKALRLQHAMLQVAAGREIHTEFRSANVFDVIRSPRRRAVVPRAMLDAEKTANAARPAASKPADRAADPDASDEQR